MAGNVIEVVIRARDEATRTVQGLQQNLARFADTKLPGANLASGLATSIEKIGPSSIVAAAGIGAVALAAAAATKQLIEVADAGGRYADSLGDIAQRTGLTTEEISKLKYAAEQSDTSIDAVAGSIRFLARNLYEAREAGSEAQKAFLEVGYSQAELEAGSVNAQQALLRMADAVKDAPSQLDRMAIATKFLGRGAVDLLPFLSQGSAGIRELTAEASQFGQVVSSQASEAGDRYTKSLLAMHGAMNALKAEIGSGVLPALTDFILLVTQSIAGVEELARRITSLGGVFKEFGAAGDVSGIDRFFRALRDQAEAAFPPLLAIEASLRFISTFAPKIPQPEKRGTGFEDVIIRGSTVDKQGLDDAKERRRLAAEAEAREAAKKAAEAQAKEMAKLLEAFEKVRLASFSVSDAIVKSLRAAIPSIADVTKAIEGIQKALNDAPVEIGKQVLKGIPAGPDGKPLSASGAVGQSIVNAQPALGGELDDIPPKIHEAVEAGSVLASMFESIGVNVEALNERLAITGESITSFGILGEVAAQSINVAFGAAFDPFLNAIDGVMTAVGNLKQTFDQAFQSLGQAILSGSTGFLRLSNVISGTVNAVKRLIVELTLAIVKAAILRAIGAAIGLTGGGTVVDSIGQAARGGTVNRESGVAHFLSGGMVARGAALGTAVALAAGGAIPTQVHASTPPAIVRLVSGGAITSAPIIRLAAGGAISSNVSNLTRVSQSWAHMASGGAISNVSQGDTFNSFSNVVHAAGGVRLVPGFPQSYDSVPAMLAPGEVVLPNVGGQSPSNLLGDLSGLKKQLEQFVGAGMQQQATAAAPMIGELHVHATDADSVENALRPGGAIDRALAQRDELGRSTW